MRPRRFLEALAWASNEPLVCFRQTSPRRRARGRAFIVSTPAPPPWARGSGPSPSRIGMFRTDPPDGTPLWGKIAFTAAIQGGVGARVDIAFFKICWVDFDTGSPGFQGGGTAAGLFEYVGHGDPPHRLSSRQVRPRTVPLYVDRRATGARSEVALVRSTSAGRAGVRAWRSWQRAPLGSPRCSRSLGAGIVSRLPRRRRVGVHASGRRPPWRLPPRTAATPERSACQEKMARAVPGRTPLPADALIERELVLPKQPSSRCWAGLPDALARRDGRRASGPAVVTQATARWVSSVAAG